MILMKDLQNKASDRNLTSLTAFTLAHFIVDFSCAFLLFRLRRVNAFPDNNVWGFFLAYNVLAFGLEFVIGSFFKLRTARICSCVGCCVLALGLGLGAYIETSIARHLPLVLQSSNDWSDFAYNSSGIQKISFSSLSLLAIVFAGIGNAFFHVGGGIDALAHDVGRYWRGGVFISSGAIGLYIGGRLGDFAKTSFGFVVFLLVLTAVLIWIWGKELSKNKEEQEGSRVEDLTSQRYVQLFYNDWRVFPLFLAIAVVLTRSFVGFVAPRLVDFTIDDQTLLLGIACASFVGKFTGGFCADWLGARKTGAIALLLTIPCLCFPTNMSFFLIGVFLLNSTTAVTLVSAAQACVGRVGFAFGLTTLALLCGYLLYDVALKVLDFENDVETIRNALVATLFASSVGIFLSTYVVKKRKGV